ncbi:hypothetical protein WG906_07010 [Pedobacter sp. P351]|uniref:hypothetical protein n=1 Tax=Pedobacter superstes TaxID=3133441 RepID=UPI0030A0120A
MKRYLLAMLAPILFTACGVKDQADQLQALEKCTYEIISADSVYIAGTEVNNLITSEGLNLLQAPQLAFAYLRQRIPVKAILQVKITNPGNQTAGINAFEYKILIRETELLSGFVTEKISIDPAGSSIIPLKVDKDVFPLLSNQENQQAVAGFLSTNTEKKVMVTFQIKPSFLIGSEVITYPDFISINKEISNTQLIAYLKSIR